MNRRIQNEGVEGVRNERAPKLPARYDNEGRNDEEATNTPAPSRSRASFVMLWTAAVLAASAAFIVHLSMRYQTIDLGYEVGAARREQRQLIEDCRLLRLEAATLRQLPRIETIARGRLQMDHPTPERIVPIQDEGDEAPRNTAGAVQ